MARSKKNSGRPAHKRLADKELESAEQVLERARRHAARDDFGRALTDAVTAATIASVAASEAQHAESPSAAHEAVKVLRESGNLILLSVAGIERDSGIRGLRSGARSRNRTASNPPRQPGVTPLFSIRTYSSSLLSGSKEVYLIINTEGEVMDAVITESEDFGPVEETGYGNLSILELDVSGPQYRKLLKLGKRLAEVSQTRPTFRPGESGAMQASTGGVPARRRFAAANPKKRLMR